MSNANRDQRIRINLTPDQAQDIKVLTGRDAEAIELTVQELEQRIAPTLPPTAGGVVSTMIAANSNETLLAG
jgi:hypothetical protein